MNQEAEISQRADSSKSYLNKSATLRALELRQRDSTKLRLLAMSPGEHILCRQSEVVKWLTAGKRASVPVTSIKLNGDGYLILRLKVRPLHRCPNCGYER